MLKCILITIMLKIRLTLMVTLNSVYSVRALSCGSVALSKLMYKEVWPQTLCQNIYTIGQKF